MSRFIGEMMQRQHTTPLNQGLELQAGTGRLFSQTTMPEMHSSLLRDGSFAVDRFKQWGHADHITLKRGERSRLADFASEVP